MRAEASTSYNLAQTMQANVATKSGSIASTFSSVLDSANSAATSGNGASSGSAAKPDFTHMTHKEIADWANSQLKSGAMSPEGSEAFVGLSLHIPVNGAYTGLDDQETVNFLQIAQDGIASAQQHNDIRTATMLQDALSKMQQYQGKASGTDISV